jgi:opacity protein-like surface antigen
MKSLALSALIVCGAASLSMAEINGGSNTLSLMVGGGFSGSQFEQQNPSDSNNTIKERVAAPGAAIGAQFVHFLSARPNIGLGIDVLRSSLQEEDSSTINPTYNTKSRFQPTTVMALAKVTFGEGKIHPYLFGAMGFHRNSFYLDFEPKTTSPGWSDTGTRETRRFIDNTVTGFAGGAGIGMDISLTSNLFIGAEARGTYLGSGDYGTTAQAKALGLMGPARADFVTFNLLARVGVKFGA